MSLSQRLFSEAFRDMQRAMAVFEQPSLFSAAVSPSSVFGSQAGNSLFRYPATDLIEKNELYELQAELPGYDKNNIKIELPDSQTLILSGSMQEQHEARSPSPEAGEQAAATQEASGEQQQQQQQDTKSAEASSGSETQAVTKVDETAQQIASYKPQYWVNERVSGSFKRSFKFPHPVESDDIKASFENGILKVIVPKMTQTQPKQVKVE